MVEILSGKLCKRGGRFLQIGTVKFNGFGKFANGDVLVKRQHNKFTAIQNAAIKKAKLNAIPLTFDSKTSDRIGEVMVQYQIRGLNITIPYKTEIMSMLDE